MLDNDLTTARLPARIVEKIVLDPERGCWCWTAALDWGGYARLGVRGTNPKAATENHKTATVVYELLVGPIPQELELDHLCCNRACVRPSHLEPVTHAENMRRVAVRAEAARLAAMGQTPLWQADELAVIVNA